MTWEINSQQLNTVDEVVVLTYKSYATFGCSDATSTDVEFNHDTCFTTTTGTETTSYSYNVVSSGELSAWYLFLPLFHSILLLNCY